MALLPGLGRLLGRGGRSADEAADAAKAADQTPVASSRPYADSATATADAGTIRRVVSSSKPRTGSSSKLVGTAKYTALGGVGYAGVNRAGSYLDSREARKQEQAVNERFEEYQNAREELLESDLPPEAKQERLALLRESFQATVNDGGGGGPLSIFDDMGLMEMMALFIALVIIFSVVRGGS